MSRPGSGRPGSTMMRGFVSTADSYIALHIGTFHLLGAVFVRQATSRASTHTGRQKNNRGQSPISYRVIARESLYHGVGFSKRRDGFSDRDFACGWSTTREKFKW